MTSFVVARNPDPESQLPYLLRLPIGREHVVLKAREPWPRTSKVYCHRVPEGWPRDAEVVEEVAVRSCVRRGPAVDLVLARSRENRSQLVFTSLRDGREAIFWQTARTTRLARPGLRMPTRRASGWPVLTVVVDTRERYAYKFAAHQVALERRALPAGDYAVEHDGSVVAAVERKSLADLAKVLVDGSVTFQMAELAALPRAAVAVEARYAEIFKVERVTSGFLADVLARVQVRYPSVPIVFCDTHPLAEQWVYRFLGAALAEATAGMSEQGAPAPAARRRSTGGRAAPASPPPAPGVSPQLPPWDNGGDGEPAGWPRSEARHRRVDPAEEGRGSKGQDAG